MTGIGSLLAQPEGEEVLLGYPHEEGTGGVPDPPEVIYRGYGEIDFNFQPSAPSKTPFSALVDGAKSLGGKLLDVLIVNRMVKSARDRLALNRDSDTAEALEASLGAATSAALGD